MTEWYELPTSTPWKHLDKIVRIEGNYAGIRITVSKDILRKLMELKKEEGIGKG